MNKIKCKKGDALELVYWVPVILLIFFAIALEYNYSQVQTDVLSDARIASRVASKKKSYSSGTDASIGYLKTQRTEQTEQVKYDLSQTYFGCCIYDNSNNAYVDSSYYATESMVSQIQKENKTIYKKSKDDMEKYWISGNTFIIYLGRKTALKDGVTTIAVGGYQWATNLSSVFAFSGTKIEG